MKPELRTNMLMDWSAEDIANHLLPWIIDRINNNELELMKEFQGDINNKWEMLYKNGESDREPIIPEYCYDQCNVGNPNCPQECQDAIQKFNDLVQKVRDVSKIIRDELAKQGLQLPGDKRNAKV